MCDIQVTGCQFAEQAWVKAQPTFFHVSPDNTNGFPVM